MKEITKVDLERKLAAHKKWLAGEGGERLDLRNLNLKGADFEGVDLRGAWFGWANLEGVNFKGAKMYDTVLKGANLKDADFEGADLFGADLSLAKLLRANFRKAVLYRANLSGAVLDLADFRGAGLEGVNLFRASFRWANLHGANIDFSCWPLSCDAFNVNADRRLFAQLLKHVVMLDVSECDEEVRQAMTVLRQMPCAAWFDTYRSDVPPTPKE